MTITKEGALASFYTVNKAPIKHLKVYFSPKQEGSGDAAPDNVRKINGWESVTFFNKSNIIPIIPTNTGPTEISGITYTYLEDGSLYFNGTVESVTRFDIPINQITLPAGYSYNFITQIDKTSTVVVYSSTVVGMALRNLDNTKNSVIVNINSIHEDGLYSSASAKLNNSITAGYIRIVLVPGTINLKIKTVIINEDLNLSDYYKYTSFGDTYYGGYVDLVTGELVETHKKLTCDGSIGFIYSNSGMVGQTIVTLGGQEPDTTENQYYPMNYVKSDTPVVGDEWVGYIRNGGLMIRVPKTEITSWQSWSSYLSEHPLEFIYKLATPITHQLTPIQLSTLIGQNNIWSNADRVEVEYDLAESNDELYRRRNVLLRSAPHIETASGNMVHFETDMVAPIKSAKISFSPVQAGSGDPSPENVRAISGWSGITIGNQSFNPGPYTAYTSNNGTYCDIKTGQTFKFEGTSEGLALLNIYREDGSGIGSLRPMKNTNGVQWDTYTATEDIARFIFVNSQVTNGYVHMLNNTTEIDWQTAAGTIYGGYVDLIKGEVVKTYSIINLGIVDWAATNATIGLFYTNNINVAGAHKGQNVIPDCICDKMIIKTRDEMANNSLQQGAEDYWLGLTINIYNKNFVMIKSPNFINMTPAEVKAAVNGTYLCLKLPPDKYSYYQLSPTALYALRGTNNIWSNANGPVEIKYWTH